MISVEMRPRITTFQAEEFAFLKYGLHVTAEEMPSSAIRTFRLRSGLVPNMFLRLRTQRNSVARLNFRTLPSLTSPPRIPQFTFQDLSLRQPKRRSQS